MVEQRPFKALVVGSSPTQPSFDFSSPAQRNSSLAISSTLSRLELPERRQPGILANHQDLVGKRCRHVYAIDTCSRYVDKI